MLKRTMFVLLTLTILATTIGWAGSPVDETRRDHQEIAKDKHYLDVGKDRIKQLSNAMDLWHDANLKGDQGKIDKYAQELNNMLHKDMEATARVLAQAQVERVRSAREYRSDDKQRSEKADDKRDLVDDRRDAQQLRGILKVKKRLASSIAKSPAFSNKYRLLGDYMDVMKQEVGLTRLELVEDVQELHEDR